MKRILSCWLLTLMVCLATSAQAALTIEIVGGSARKIPIAVVPFGTEQLATPGISGIVRADLGNSGEFNLVDTNGVSPPPSDPAEVRFPDWAGRNAEALAIGKVLPRGPNLWEVQFRLFDVAKQTQLAGQSWTVSSAQLRAVAHQISDMIYEKLTGQRGVFSTRIAYVTKQGGSYALEVADADGFGASAIVRSRDPIISPTWAPDGRHIAYVSFERKRTAVYIQSLDTTQRRAVASFKGTNSAPSFSPDGRQLALSLSRDGPSQIYVMNTDGSGLRKVTHGSAIDTEPTWSADGSHIYFTSDRGGSPQIYRVPASGGDASRITFSGSYNVSPDVSPDGKTLAYVQREGGKFRIAVQDLSTGQSQVLTDSRLDESPSFAPNGRVILYATEVGGRGELATVSSDGRIKRKLTSAGGDVREPAWGPYSKTSITQ